LTDLVAILTRLSSTPGISGYEGPIRDVVIDLWRQYADEIYTDRMGSVIAVKHGSGAEPRRRAMLAAHMDEIGLMVASLDKGFLHVTGVGGIDIRLLPGQEVVVHASRRGPDGQTVRLPGVIGARPPHLQAPGQRDNTVPMDETLVDVGLSADELERWVRVGDLITFAREGAALGSGRFSGRALDNRASVAAVTVCLETLQTRRHTWDAVAVATVQEEVTLGGARTSGFHVVPDLAIALDVTFGRGPGVGESDTFPLGEGPTVAIGPNLHPKVVEQLKAAAGRLEMDIQIEPESGPTGTDAWALQITQAGIPCGLVGIPLRNMHSPVEVLSVKDVERAGRLCAETIAGLPDDFLATQVIQ